MRRIALLGSAGLVVLLLVVAQLVLPGIAAQQLRDRLARSGTVISVQVSAFPAIELLWHQADRIDVRLASYHSSTGGLGHLLDQAAQVGTIVATIDLLKTGLITLHKVTLSKRGDVLKGTAILTEADLQAALPPGLTVEPIASGDGKLVLQGSALGLSADATVGAQDGELLLAPDVPLLGGLLTFTLFKDPHVDVQGVGASSVPGGFAMFANARLR
jgi:hypothetical protein